ncbi:hypothetical protein RhiirB3_394916 [Rhizophagus irregularis]|nr:hypothetical protein RhiirB3_394916 [Rhizophagus irregularis]
MNDTLIKSLESVCQERSIDFITKNNHVRCLAHIINLATQAALSSLKVEYVENENILLNDTDEITKVIPKALDNTVTADRNLRKWELVDSKWKLLEKIKNLLHFLIPN